MENDLFIPDVLETQDQIETFETIQETTYSEEQTILLNDILHSLQTTNTLIMIIFIVSLCILIYNFFWKFIRIFIN